MSYPFVVQDKVTAAELNLLAETNRIEKIIGEAIDGTTTPQAVAMGGGGSYEIDNSATDTDGESITNVIWYSQKFTTTSNGKQITGVTLRFRHSQAGSKNTTLTAHIYADSAGKPTGSSLGSKAVNEDIETTGTTVTFLFDTPIDISSSTDYHIVIHNDTTVDIFIKRGDTGSTGTNKSTDTGSSWSAHNGKLFFAVDESDTVAGKVYKTDASFLSDRVNKFAGFIKTNIAEDADAIIFTGGVVGGFTGLTEGADYYISDTLGTISTSAGTNSKKIGMAFSTTEIFIKHENS